MNLLLKKIPYLEYCSHCFFDTYYNIIKYAQQIEEAHVDATYKTAKGRFELYGVVGEIDGSGFPLAYCLMDTSKNTGSNE